LNAEDHAATNSAVEFEGKNHVPASRRERRVRKGAFVLSSPSQIPRYAPTERRIVRFGATRMH
jgi:hypothetical protein